jgi:hypothetical protein
MSRVLRFLSTCDLFTDSPSYFEFTFHQFYLATLYSLGTVRVVLLVIAYCLYLISTTFR